MLFLWYLLLSKYISLQSVSDEGGKIFVWNRLQRYWSKVVNFGGVTFFIYQNGDPYPPCIRRILRLPTICYYVMQDCTKDRAFLSEITLIWSNGQADEPARAFFIIEAISAYEGGERSNGVAGGGRETNHCGI